MLSKLGAIESSEATELLTSTMNGFKMGTEDAMHAVDALVNIDLLAATSTEELATAMQYVASVADQAGVSFERMIGYIAVGSETTRLSAQTIGQGWKSILSRYGNVAAGKDTDDMGEPINNVEKVLNKLGIQLRQSNGDMRDFGSVLDDVAAKWETLNKTEQNQVATAMAG